MTDYTEPAVAPLSGVEKLTTSHDVSQFDCERNPELNDWLKRFALVNQASDSAQTYVVHRAMRVIGYYSLTAGSVRHDEAPARMAKGLAKHPIGVIILARLAVDKPDQRKGIGKALLKDALFRIMAAADTVGARAVLVHAIDDQAAKFYKDCDFEPSPIDPLVLMLLMKDLRAQLNK